MSIGLIVETTDVNSFGFAIFVLSLCVLCGQRIEPLRAQRKNYHLADPFSTLAGKDIITSNNSNTDFIVMPTSLNGKSNSQTIGYTIKTKIANGQQIKSSITHNKNFVIMLFSF